MKEKASHEPGGAWVPTQVTVKSDRGLQSEAWVPGVDRALGKGWDSAVSRILSLTSSLASV